LDRLTYKEIPQKVMAIDQPASASLLLQVATPRLARHH
jgi:hypothetical protein